MKITIQGVVWQPIEAAPRLAAFGRLSANAAEDGTLVRKLTIVNNMGEEANLTNLRSTSPMFKAEFTVLEPGKKFELTVSLVPPFRPGNNNGSIEFSTGLKEMPTLKVSARVFITPDVDVMPPKLVLRPNRTAPLKRELSVKSKTDKPLVISDLQTTNPRIKTTLTELIAGKQYKIAVEIPADYDAPKSGDKITFKTNISTMPSVEVPVQVMATRKSAKSTVRRSKGAPLNTQAITRPGRPASTPQQVGAKPAPAQGAKPAPAQGAKPASTRKEKPTAAKEAKQPEKATTAAKPNPRDHETGGETR